LKIVTAAGQSDEMLLKHIFRFHERESNYVFLLVFIETYEINMDVI